MQVLVVAHCDMNGTLDKAERMRQDHWLLSAHEILRDRPEFKGVDLQAEIHPEVFEVSLGLGGKDVISAVACEMKRASACFCEISDQQMFDLVTEIRAHRSRVLKDFEDNGYPLRDGAAEFIREAHGLGVRFTIVTSETEEHVEKTLLRSGVRDYFDGIVARDTINGHGQVPKKPGPEPYMVAVERMMQKYTPNAALHAGLEDTDPGMASALRALRAGSIQQVIHSHDILPWAKIRAHLLSRQFTPEESQLCDGDHIALVNASFPEISAHFRRLKAA